MTAAGTRLGIGEVPRFVNDRRPGACADDDVDARWFEPSWGENADVWIDMDKARAVCRRCPVRVECLTWAVPIKDLEGMWGAKTPDERARLRRVS